MMKDSNVFTEEFTTSSAADPLNHRVLITPPFIRPGDPIDTYLREHGIETIFNETGKKLGPEALAQAIQHVDGVIVAGEKLDAEVLVNAKRLRVVARTGVGYDQIDVPYLSQRGISVCVTAGMNHRSVAEMALTHLLMAAKRIPESHREYEQGIWLRPIGRELGNTTIGIIGLGTIGKRLVELLKPFGCRVLAYDLYPDRDFAALHGVEFHDWQYVLAESDFLSLHLFLNAESRHWLDAEKISIMKSDAVVVNTARGGVIDEHALIEAIDSGRLAGAGLDVTQNEPLPLDDPLRGNSRIFVTPHLGGSTREARSFGGMKAAKNIVSVLQGTITEDVINQEALQR
ncbi:MAG: phosphoglycerate dehydrogenase [Microbacteriaceae bacterium]